MKKKGAYIIPTTPNGPAMIASVSGHLHVHTATPAKCELCGVIEELRPYGPGGKNVCFDCMMKDEKTAKKLFYKQFK